MKILAAEDNPVSQAVLRSLLTKWGYEVVIARDGNEAWRILQTQDPPKLAILDWMMPGIDGVDVCRRVRAGGREPYIYILLLTSRGASDDLVEGMDSGADDYLVKPFNAPELRARLRAGERLLALQEQLLTTREELLQRATHDSLTGLLNRPAILETMQIELERTGRQSQHLSVLMADLDHFKQINDHSGHLAGDAVLREVAGRMKSAIRCYDSLGRYGGEEFLFVLPGCDEAGAVAQAERVRVAVTSGPISYEGELLAVTCSVGAVCRHAGAATDIDALIREADLALYAAKWAGRNRIECASVETAARRGPGV